MAQLYPQAVGSLFVASYGSQGYGGGIRTRLHAGVKQSESESVRFTLRLAVYRHSVPHGANSLEVDKRYFSLRLNP
jgi:hypothetical protein